MASKGRMSVLLAKIGITACAVGVIFAAAAIGGFRLQLFSVFPALAGYAASMLALAFATPVMLVAMIGARGRLGRWTFNATGWIALVACVCLTLNNLLWFRQAQVSPTINDISTDTTDPPAFVDLLPLRGPGANPPEHPGDSVARQQRSAYPEIEPVFLEADVAGAVGLAAEAAHSLGWSIVAQAPGEGRLEAVATTAWFGLKGDIVVRVTPAEGGVMLDVRSKSRVGTADMGTNARRIRHFLAALRDSATLGTNPVGSPT